MVSNKDHLKKRIEVAAKREKADVVLKNGQVIDIFNHQIMKVDVAITDGMIVGLGDYEGIQEIDVSNKFISPSFIDGHVHIESSMATPVEFAKVVLPHGVTTVIADPHEIANVAGVEGIQYMLDASEDIPLNVYYMLPSCVPATQFENAGAVLKAEDLQPFYDHPRVLGLGEVMDYPAVFHAEEEMMNKLSGAYKAKAKIDGHAAGLDETSLNVYLTAGIRTDHEAVNEQEALDRLRRGMYLIIREGSVAKDLINLIGVVTEKNSRRCLFGTDDKHLDDLIQNGTIDYCVRLAIQHGIDPLTAIEMASLNAAECFGIHTKGAIAPGYDADILILNNLEQVEIDQVFVSGKRVVENNQLIAKIEGRVKPSEALTNSVRITNIGIQQLQIPMESSHKANVIEITPNSLITKHQIEEVDIEQGNFQISIPKDQLKLVVVERHHLTGNIGLGIVKGLKLKKGAIATTIAHDSHNIIVAGTNDRDILFAIKRMEEIGGGLVVVEQEKVLAELPLVIGGLLSIEDAQTIHTQLDEIHHALEKLEAATDFNPFLTLSFLALPVIPNLKLTDQGLFDVAQFKHISVNQFHNY